MSLLNTTGIDMFKAPPSPQCIDEFQQYVAKQNQASYQNYIDNLMAQPVDPRVKTICDEKKIAAITCEAEKELEALRAQVAEAAKRTPVSPLPISSELRATVMAAIQKRNPQAYRLLSEELEKGDAPIGKALSTAVTAVPLSPLECANKIVTERERRELQPGGAFRWTDRMG